MVKKDGKNNKGFSFIELLIVLAIVGILSAIIAPSVVNFLEKRAASTSSTVIIQPQEEKGEAPFG